MDQQCLRQAFEFLIRKSKEQGYVSLDDVLSCGFSFKLKVDDVDRLSGLLSESGVILGSKPPVKIQSSPADNDDNEILSNTSDDSILQNRAEDVYKAVVNLDESLGTFIDYVRLIPPADKKEMVHIQYQLIEGNEYARQRAIEGNLRIAVILAYREAISFNKDITECVGEACLALITACDSYRPDDHQTFAGYISLAIIDSLARSSNIPLFSIPANILNVCRRVYKKKIFFSLNEKNAIKFIQSNSNFDEVRASTIYNILYYSFVDELEIENNCEKIYSENSYENFRSNAENELERKKIKSLLNLCLKKTLSSKEIEILNLRFGLNGYQPSSLLEIAEVKKVSRERIRQIEKKAISKLKNKKHSIESKFPFVFNEYVAQSPNDDEELC